MKRATLVVIMLAGAAAHADPAFPSEESIKAVIAKLSRSYGDVRPIASCRAPIGADKFVCSNKMLSLMDQLDSMAYVYAVENGTHSEASHATTRDAKWIRSTRNKCKTEACLVNAMIQHTNDSLGGDSPYQ
jgi:uncharacterized protein